MGYDNIKSVVIVQHASVHKVEAEVNNLIEDGFVILQTMVCENKICFIMGETYEDEVNEDEVNS